MNIFHLLFLGISWTIWASSCNGCPFISKNEMHFRKSVSVTESFAMTIRLFATGDAQQSRSLS